MEFATHTRSDLLVKQVLHSVRNNRVRENNPSLNMRLVHSKKQSSEKTDNSEITKLCIKNMMTIRCKIVVKAVLEDLGLKYSTVDLGEVKIFGKISNEKQEQLKSNLLKYGLELMEDKRVIFVEKIKKVIIEMILCLDELPNINFSDYLSKKLNYNYTYLANIFSEVQGMSIQNFIIIHKIERVKELLVYDELTLSEIAFKVGYSSTAHLSNQFKKNTGLTPTHFKKMKNKKLNLLDNI